MYFIGVDLGTSACKFLLMDERGEILNITSGSYDVEYPRPGWSQQNPEDWWRAVREGVPELLAGFDASQVAGIGCGGQMHGLVALDEKDQVIRPAILWNDGRTGEQVRFLNGEVGISRLLKLTGNIAYAGFTAPKLLWMRDEESELFSRIAHVLLPKDYLNHLLTGEYATDVSDASGMLLFDVERRTWSDEMLELCGLTPAQMPRVYESYEPIGTLLPEVADELGLPRGVVVAAGAGDNAAAAVGTGAVGAGTMNISLGTSGTVFIPTAEFASGVGDRIHSFCHADGAWHLMGCILSAASCNAWWVNDVLGTDDMAAEQAGIDGSSARADLPYFLPYLMGERTPLNDVNARGAFVGMSMSTTRSDLTRAVLEGVAFAVRDSVEIARSLGVDVTTSTVCGGGAKSRLWLQMLADVLGIELVLPTTEQGPGYGGAMLASVAAGAYPSVAACAGAIVGERERIEPKLELTAAYERRYQIWHGLYPALRDTFETMGARND
ncbi:xylulokinase [Thermophilibacter provencensis]|uniref:Xylulose kinase n=1 Tax=Thermophilibacter provencensis TaxID=1852386 RepID=A0ABT7V3C7_9ACTN|nr:xylulokinase [Thermophilibacter provencensis]MDM8271105.1 xylulokinase [Thermophilibacter provencensis]